MKRRSRGCRAPVEVGKKRNKLAVLLSQPPQTKVDSPLPHGRIDGSIASVIADRLDISINLCLVLVIDLLQ